MKKYYVAIPAIIAIAGASSFLLYPHSSSTNTIIPVSALMGNGSPILGNPDAKITIVEWGDYQCTYCHLFQENTKDQLVRDYVDTGKVNFVFRDFPLNGPDSVFAAEASYCAGDQGKYWQYHDELYRNWGGERTGWINQASLDHFAGNIGLDLGSFDKCLADKKYEEKVLSNEKFGQEIGVDATPTFIIFTNDKAEKMEGAQPLSVFQQVIDNI